MNFFDFLEKHSSETQPIAKTTFVNVTPQVQTSTFKVIKKGDMVKIKAMQNSPYNVYKGYLAEIKEYKQGSDYARVFLHAVCHHNNIKLHIDHFSVL